MNRVEELNMFKDDQVSEYHTLNEPFEEILYDFKNKPGKKNKEESKVQTYMDNFEEDVDIIEEQPDLQMIQEGEEEEE